MHWKMFLLWPFLLGISALQCWDKPKNKEFATLSEKGGGVHLFFCSQAVGSGVAAVGDGVVSGVTAVQEVAPKNPLTKKTDWNPFQATVAAGSAVGSAVGEAVDDSASWAKVLIF